MSNTTGDETTAPPVVRRDRYTIVVEDYAVCANVDQERRIREMDDEARARFLAIMGRK
jgi:hypothetical protein